MAAKPLQPLVLDSIGIYGLNRQSSAASLEPQWLTTANNIMLDEKGRLSTRKGIKQETKKIKGITFNIKREIANEKIIKTIAFNDNDKEYCFQEKVQLLTLENFKTLLIKANFKLIKSFGNYQLTEFNAAHSERLILIAEKK